MLKFLVGRRRGHEEALAVTCCEAPDYARAGDGRVDDGNDVCELGLEDGVEVCRSALGNQSVTVCEGGEDANSGWLLANADLQTIIET